MKLVAVCWLLLLTIAQGQTLRLSWKPADFQPLHSLPWKDTELHEVPIIVERIFREPNPAIRYPVLAEYLRQVPMLHFGLAFETATSLEGTQKPNEVVALMLRIWAQRDPQSAWERTQHLARLVGFEEGVLNYDSWNGRPKIQVQDLAALRASRYWLGRHALLTFPIAVEASEIPQTEKLRLLRAFANLWFEKFQCWPETRAGAYSNDEQRLTGMLHAGSYDQIRQGVMSSYEEMSTAAFEVQLRRWLFEHPEEGPEILQRLQHQHWTAGPVAPTPEQNTSASRDLLLLWSQLDSKSLVGWSDSVEQTMPETAWLARCIMMSQVDKAMRDRWISSIGPNEIADRLHVLAPWNPELAMECAIRANDVNMIQDVANTAVYGFGGRTWNRSHAGLGFINSFDLQKLPKEMLGQVFEEGGTAIMEQWKDVDVGEAARYGFRSLMQQSWPSKDELLRFFSGVDLFPDQGGMTDRTFCTLRVWAVLRPDEMRTWISKQKGADARKALTWLVEHPWGGGAKEVEKEKK